MKKGGTASSTASNRSSDNIDPDDLIDNLWWSWPLGQLNDLHGLTQQYGSDFHATTKILDKVSQSIDWGIKHAVYM